MNFSTAYVMELVLLFKRNKSRKEVLKALIEKHFSGTGDISSKTEMLNAIEDYKNAAVQTALDQIRIDSAQSPARQSNPGRNPKKKRRNNDPQDSLEAVEMEAILVPEPKAKRVRNAGTIALAGRELISALKTGNYICIIIDLYLGREKVVAILEMTASIPDDRTLCTVPAQNWVSRTWRPITSCLKNHHNDSVDEFIAFHSDKFSYSRFKCKGVLNQNCTK
jgi:hypothetical protein